MSKETGGPAFPNGVADASSGAYHIVDDMTLRDYFANGASDKDVDLQITLSDGGLSRAAARYRHADAMLKERDK